MRVRNISVEDVIWPLLVEGFYGQGSQGESAVQLANLTFESVTGSAFTGAEFHCDEVRATLAFGRSVYATVYMYAANVGLARCARARGLRLSLIHI